MTDRRYPVIAFAVLWTLVVIICGLQTVSCKSEPTTTEESTAATEEPTTERPTIVLEPYTEPNREWVSVIEPTTEEPTTERFKGHTGIPLSLDVQEHVIDVQERYGISEILIYAMIRTESNFKFVMGDNGNSVGYMQIQPKWWQKMANDNGIDLYSEKGNIELGAMILRLLLDKYNNDVTKALKAYNGGKPDGNNDWYVQRVFKYYNEMEGLMYE